jgi:hypothetical protein
VRAVVRRLDIARGRNDPLVPAESTVMDLALELSAQSHGRPALEMPRHHRDGKPSL